MICFEKKGEKEKEIGMLLLEGMTYVVLIWKTGIGSFFHLAGKERWYTQRH